MSTPPRGSSYCFVPFRLRYVRLEPVFAQPPARASKRVSSSSSRTLSRYAHRRAIRFATCAACSCSVTRRGLARGSDKKRAQPRAVEPPRVQGQLGEQGGSIMSHSPRALTLTLRILTLLLRLAEVARDIVAAMS